MDDCERTIPCFFRARAEACAPQPWLVTTEGTVTYGEALAAVARGAAGLRAAGVVAGDRVMVTARTTPAYVLAWLALMEVGAVEVPVNPISAVAELAGVVGQVRPAAVVTDRELAPALAPV
ncbi:MAG: AMP-binding protein, partial [Acidimicrobiales bacterium]